jgi:rod shape determining protein RodA
MSTKKSRYDKIDWGLFFLYLSIALIGVIAIFSVEYRATDLNTFSMSKSFMKQSMWLGISLVIGFVILLLDSKMYTTVSFLAYAVGIALLLLVLVAGTGVKGSRSWLELGFFRFQPGELAKVFTAMALSKYMSSQQIDFRSNMSHRMIAIGMIIIPAILIILSNETGLAIVYFSFFLAMYREGLPRIYLILGFSIILLTLLTLLIPKTILLFIFTGVAILFMVIVRKELMRNRELLIITIVVWLITIMFSQVLVPFAFKNLKAHQVDRIYTMLGKDVPDEYIKIKADGEKIKTGSSEYNVRQSIIAIGSGGFIGKGVLNGTQTQMNFVPEQRTDFIFCSIGEQFGFLGSSLLIILYLLLLLRIIKIGETQRSLYTRIYAYSVAGILFFHLFINVGMTIGLVPVIGIPLPMLSYGGTSLLTFSILIFILIRLDMDKHTVLR